MRTFDTLTTKIASWLERDDAGFIAMIPDFIEMAHQRIFRELRVPLNEKVANYVIETADYIDLPADFLEVKLVIHDGNPLARVSDAEILRRNAIAVPSAFARLADRFYFDSSFAGDIDVIYYMEPDVPSDTVPTNVVLDNSPELYLFAALAEASMFLLDEQRAAIWEQKFKTAMKEIERHARKAELAGGGLSIAGGY